MYYIQTFAGEMKIYIQRRMIMENFEKLDDENKENNSKTKKKHRTFIRIIIAVLVLLVAAAVFITMKIIKDNKEKENYKSDVKQIQEFIQNTKGLGDDPDKKLTKANALDMKSDWGIKLKDSLTDFFPYASKAKTAMIESAIYKAFGQKDTSGWKTISETYIDKMADVHSVADKLNNYCESKKLGSEYSIDLDELDKVLDCLSK